MNTALYGLIQLVRIVSAGTVFWAAHKSHWDLAAGIFTFFVLECYGELREKLQEIKVEIINNGRR